MLRRLTHFRLLSAMSLFLATGLFVTTSAGCKSWGRWNLLEEDEGFSDEDQKLTKDLRPAEPNSKSWSVTEKGRQIDQNFGIGRGR
jgi:hypothetical protein